jgi:hypothetical protein
MEPCEAVTNKVVSCNSERLGDLNYTKDQREAEPLDRPFRTQDMLLAQVKRHQRHPINTNVKPSFSMKDRTVETLKLPSFPPLPRPHRSGHRPIVPQW